MTAIATLQDLLVLQLRNLYTAERQKDEDNEDMEGGADDRDTGKSTSRASDRPGRTKVGSRRH